MDYKSQDSYRFAYSATAIILFPLFLLLDPKYQVTILILPFFL